VTEIVSETYACRGLPGFYVNISNRIMLKSTCCLRCEGKYFTKYTLFGQYEEPYSYFPGFENIVFYNNDDIIGDTISHERQIDLFLTEEETKDLVNRGVVGLEKKNLTLLNLKLQANQ
jgi:hypothetical protein